MPTTTIELHTIRRQPGVKLVEIPHQTKAHTTGDPNLFVHKELRYGYTWDITHQPSGRVVLDRFVRLKDAKEWAERLIPLADFTQSAEQLQANAALMDLIRQHRHEYADRRIYR